ncbi:DUF2622 domain-containing protein [Xanthomonas pisi]|uniref:DUF2622 domain-containing protein n=1 Tax=Xanthomonas pisi TaxID=56457 RepID=UPI000AA15FA6|nr:DUF2622 domain-containing protein [Xanthomonas pisi]
MPSFTTRVVLNDAEWEEYEELYEYMAAEGFAKTITSGQVVTYKLPDAEYDYRGNLTKENVLKKARSAAQRTGKRHSVLVTESVGRTWDNLDQV